LSGSRSNLSMIGAGLLIGVGLGLLLLAVIGMQGSLFPGLFNNLSVDQPIAVPEVNSPAPDFQLQNLSGEALRLSDFRGKPVLINFWATWCGPCQLEMPLIQKYYEKHSPDLVVLAVNNDEPRDAVQAFVDQMKLTFPILLDPGARVEDQYRVRAFPTSLFINREGLIRYQHIGILNEQQLVQYLKQIGVGE
jgi:cytochrome c biogenesis protein CcmG, thiol:disulfide interchange protein DsbE